jgi:hypothetical protein
MLMGGQAFATRRYVFWNFVRRGPDHRPGRLKAQRSLIPGDDQNIFRCPEVPTTVSYP